MNNFVDFLQKQTVEWVLTDVNSDDFKAQIQLFKELKITQSRDIKDMKPKICLKCWLVFASTNNNEHKNHNQTSEFALMETATAEIFKGLCKNYDRLTPDGKRIILMKVHKRVYDVIRE